MTAWLLDTGPLVAFFDRSEARHDWAKEDWAQAPIPMLTCEAVLAEATYLLHERAGLPPEKVLALLERKVVPVPFFIEDHAPRWTACWNGIGTGGCNWPTPAWCACPN
jgi:predicted nucleic acid-binding protein